LTAALLSALAPQVRAFQDSSREPVPRSASFACSFSSENFYLASDEVTPLETLAWVAEETQRRTRAWLGVTAPESARRHQIYFSDQLETLYALERQFGLVPSRAYHATHPFTGRCYPEAGLIVIPYHRAELRRWQVAHEVVHTVFQEIVGRNVEVINEGLAELLPSWILNSTVESPELIDAKYELYDRRCAQAILAHEVPPFATFARIESDQFYDANAGWLWYALSWKLVKVLVESDHSQIRGRFPRFLRVLADGNGVWPALRAVYDTNAVEAAWQAEIDRTAPWQSLFGGWRYVENALVGTATGRHSATAITTERAYPGEPFVIGFTLDQPPPQGCAVGFTLEAQGVDDFVYVQFRPGGRQIAVARRSRGVWTEVVDYQLPDEPCIAVPNGARGRRVELVAEPGGYVRVSVDGYPMLRHALGADHAGGSIGLMLERCEDDPTESVQSEIRFRDVVITR
jgi:hypothetical protein